MRITARTITEALISRGRPFDYSTHIVLPNAWWGLDFNHEIDLLSVTKAGWATEVEIKISLSDLKADLKKWHQHRSTKIKYFYFAIPTKIVEKGREYVPEHAGIIEIQSYNKRLYPKIMRRPVKNKKARKFTEAEIQKALKLCYMRYWNQHIKLTQQMEQRIYQLEMDLNDIQMES